MGFRGAFVCHGIDENLLGLMGNLWTENLH
jgi:hypothetical protein